MNHVTTPPSGGRSHCVSLGFRRFLREEFKGERHGRNALVVVEGGGVQSITSSPPRGLQASGLQLIWDQLPSADHWHLGDVGKAGNCWVKDLEDEGVTSTSSRPEEQSQTITD
ncbi:unnamed protein product [Pleuronectes platessa]|uniref:Uncharacterized protein n=1 Tax=Pleuronectes platessa TaxID=8262 RepID=A0A9N7VKH0_PLEPL|nr:unnamed protein product [Pleuronectes platessa]